MSKDKLAVGYTDTEKIGIWRSRALNIKIYRLKSSLSVGDSSFSFCLALRVAARRSGLSNRSSCFFPWWDPGSNSFIVSSRSHGFGSCLMFTFTLTPMHRGEKELRATPKRESSTPGMDLVLAHFGPYVTIGPLPRPPANLSSYYICIVIINTLTILLCIFK